MLLRQGLSCLIEKLSFISRQNLILVEEGLTGKDGQSLEGDSGFLEIAIINFRIMNLVWLAIDMQTKTFCISCYFSLIFLAYFVLIFILTKFYFTVYFRGEVHKS